MGEPRHFHSWALLRAVVSTLSNFCCCHRSDVVRPSGAVGNLKPRADRAYGVQNCRSDALRGVD